MRISACIARWWLASDTRYHFDYDWGREIVRGVSGVFRREAREVLIDYGAASAEVFDKMMGDPVDGQECCVVHSQLFASDLSGIDGGEGFAMEGFSIGRFFDTMHTLLNEIPDSWRNARR